MSFKDQLKKDAIIFINSNEFADTHTLNLDIVECVVMSADKDTDANLQSKKGTITSYKSITVQTSLLNNGIPQPNDYLELDGSLFKVSALSEIEGMVFIDVARPIGKFDKAITIQKFTTTKVNGFQKETWVDYHSCSAYIRNMNADDMLKLGTIVNNRTIFIKIAYKEGITSKMRLVYKDTYYNITSIDNIEENNVFIDLVCEVSL